MSASLGTILVVDDDIFNRLILIGGLEEQGYTVAEAADGAQAVELLHQQHFDVVLLDLVMPGLDGFKVLEHMKADPALQHIPVIVVSAEHELPSVVRCIEMGAIDHLPKPVDPVLLRARVNASLAAKKLHDQEQTYLQIIQAEHEKADRLLLNILPVEIVARLKQGETLIADSFPAATVLFADLVGFTALSASMTPSDLVTLLTEVFSMFDQLVQQHGVEKIKTMGDAYLAVGGVPTPRPDHGEAIAALALDMQAGIARINAARGYLLHLRTGIATGPIIAGVISSQKFRYDIWGDTVNTASRMESHGLAGHIQVTTETYTLLRAQFNFQERGIIQVKDKGPMRTYFLLGRK